MFQELPQLNKTDPKPVYRPEEHLDNPVGYRSYYSSTKLGINIR
jgi:hypothetical protein